MPTHEFCLNYFCFFLNVKVRTKFKTTALIYEKNVKKNKNFSTNNNYYQLVNVGDLFNALFLWL
jgi:hypothetical protein